MILDQSRFPSPAFFYAQSSDLIRIIAPFFLVRSLPWASHPFRFTKTPFFYFGRSAFPVSPIAEGGNPPGLRLLPSPFPKPLLLYLRFSLASFNPVPKIPFPLIFSFLPPDSTSFGSLVTGKKRHSIFFQLPRSFNKIVFVPPLKTCCCFSLFLGWLF